MENSDYIMWLNRTLSQNSKKIHSLISFFETPENVFKAGRNELMSFKGLKSAVIDKMIEGREKIFQWKHELDSNDIRFISFMDKEFPSRLLNMPIVPAGIYVKGKLPDDNVPAVSIIGSRRCSEYGRRIADKFAYELAQSGVCVISGMAAGIDSISNKAVIKGGGITIGVLGFGHFNCYPSENRKLMEEIAQKGCLVSEYPPDTKPEPYYFPQRNQIIAGLCDGLLVVEAAKNSGTLITASAAADFGRAVMAVPSNITSYTGEGSNELIKDGCCVVTKCEDILYELRSYIWNETVIENKTEVTETKEEAYDGIQALIMSIIYKEPVAFEYIAAKTGISARDLQSELAMLEIIGSIEKLPGDRYVRK